LYAPVLNDPGQVEPETGVMAVECDAEDPLHTDNPCRHQLILTLLQMTRCSKPPLQAALYIKHNKINSYCWMESVFYGQIWIILFYHSIHVHLFTTHSRDQIGTKLFTSN